LPDGAGPRKRPVILRFVAANRRRCAEGPDVAGRARCCRSRNGCILNV
jgi:hypothetical protein